jgi:hypothetical protein
MEGLVFEKGIPHPLRNTGAGALTLGIVAS